MRLWGLWGRLKGFSGGVWVVAVAQVVGLCISVKNTNGDNVSNFPIQKNFSTHISNTIKLFPKTPQKSTSKR